MKFITFTSLVLVTAVLGGATGWARPGCLGLVVAVMVVGHHLSVRHAEALRQYYGVSQTWVDAANIWGHFVAPGLLVAWLLRRPAGRLGPSVALALGLPLLYAAATEAGMSATYGVPRDTFYRHGFSAAGIALAVTLGIAR